MPELPEVETVVRDLRPRAVGRTITAVRVGEKRLRTPWDAAWEREVVGRRVEAIRRRGKWIVVELGGRRAEAPNPPGPPSLGGKGGDAPTDLPGAVSASAVPREGELCGHPLPLRGRGLGGGVAPSAHPGAAAQSEPRLVVHLGMTGQFTAVAATEPAPDHLHLVFALDDATELRFRDVRRFGSVARFADDAAVEAFFADAGLGPEPFGLDPAAFRESVRGSARTLKAILLDQTVVAGVGNIYADEACSRAGLHPGRRGSSLTPAECDALRVAVEAVLTTAIAARGSTIRDYVGGSGLAGEFQSAHRVYGRTGEPCVTCRAPIERVVLGGRSSHYCPRCQLLAVSRQPTRKNPRGRPSKSSG